MKSIQFPSIFNSQTTVATVGTDDDSYDATLQNLKLLLSSEKGELFGDPDFGVHIKKYMYEQNDAILMDILIDEIYESIATFIPQVIIAREDVTIVQKGDTVYCNIRAKNRSSFKTDLYSIALLDTYA